MHCIDWDITLSEGHGENRLHPAAIPVLAGFCSSVAEEKTNQICQAIQGAVDSR